MGCPLLLAPLLFAFVGFVTVGFFTAGFFTAASPLLTASPIAGCCIWPASCACILCRSLLYSLGKALALGC